MVMEEVYDLVGVGFGPSNLALAIAVEEHNQSAKCPLNMLFFDTSADFSWHKDMLIQDSTMQISFLKDLVTLRNPTSKYSFLNYLKCCGRLVKFSNLQSFYPSRLEFHGYFKWAADQLAGAVKYSRKVIEINSYGEANINILEVIYENLLTGERGSALCRNVSIATGGIPKFPDGVCVNNKANNVWHSSTFLKNIDRFDRNFAYDFCICGGGQSAVEIVDYLYGEFPNAKISSVCSDFGFRPADDSSFVNEIFDPSTVDMFYHADEVSRRVLLESHYGTNYGVVDIDLIEKVYALHYRELVSGTQRLFFHRLTSVIGTTHKNDKVLVSLYDKYNQKHNVESFDALLLATGYTRNIPMDILHSIKDEFVYKNELPHIDRYYCLVLKEHIKASIILQGFSESLHGISDTLLSNLSIRSKEILDNVLLKPKSEICSEL